MIAGVVVQMPNKICQRKWNLLEVQEVYTFNEGVHFVCPLTYVLCNFTQHDYEEWDFCVIKTASC